jgi:possible restriction modification system DNA specificity subunit (fragment)
MKLDFCEVFDDYTSRCRKIPKEEYLSNGKYIVIDQGQNNIAGYTNIDDGLFEDVPAIVFGDHTRIIKYVDEPFFLGADGVKLLKSKIKDANYKYLYYALRNAKIPDTGYNRHFKWLKEINLEYKDAESQKNIVKTLDTVTNIIELYKVELSKLDNLIRARFVEMFGDLKNIIRLGDCCEVHARIGWQALTRNEHMKTGEYMLVTGIDFIDGKVNFDTCVYVTKERYEMDHHIILKNNDILITKDGSIGKVAIVKNLPKPATLNSGIFVVRPNETFNKEYISSVFRGPLFEKFVEVSKTGATIKHLNQKHLVEFGIPVPTIEEQKVFAEFSEQVNKSKVEVKRALDEAQLLFDSLMQKYFG